jgi:ribosome recycling factor
VAAISTPDPRSILIQPWDKNALAGIEKAIRESSLQLAPVVDGVSVRLTIPSLTQERRQEYQKLLGGKTEEARIRVRHIREDILKKVQNAVKEKTAREDDVHRAKERLQKLVDEYNGKLDEITRKKESELMSV